MDRGPPSEFKRRMELAANAKRDAVFNEIELNDIARRVPGFMDVGSRFNLDDVLENLNNQGVLLKHGHGCWKLLGHKYRPRHSPPGLDCSLSNDRSESTS
jgi:hypothetical protein